MTIYAIATLNIHDREEYSHYEAGFMDIFNQHSGKLLSVEESPHPVEGEWTYTRTVLVEFPSQAEFDRWYQSEPYQEILKHRLAASSGNLVLVNSLPTGWTMDTFAYLADTPYVSLRTFRKTGVAVDTPVWCAGHQDALYIFSAGQAGKVKRLRNGSQAAIANCDARGGSVGTWHEATAHIIEDDDEIAAALTALHKKYGWQMWVADVGSKFTGKYHKRAYIRVNLV